MGIAGNEVSAVNQQRHNEDLVGSPVGDVLGSAVAVGGATVTLATSLATGGSAGLVVAGSVVAGMGIVDWFRKLGTSKVNQNLEALGQATEDALNRVENILREHGAAIDEIKRRLVSEEFKNAMASASLQALRTTQLERLKRLALILANGVRSDDLAAEATDDMMRAAVELKDIDLILLAEIYQMQSPYMKTDHWLNKQISERWSILSGYWQKYWDQNQVKYRGLEGERLMGSFARLESLGLIAPGPNRSSASSPVASCYLLLPDGMKFYERLQEIGKQE